MTFSTLVGQLLEIVNIFVYVVFALTFVAMLVRIIDAWIIHGGDAYKAGEAKQTILIGFIVLVVMASVWGIVALLKTALPDVPANFIP